MKKLVTLIALSIAMAGCETAWKREPSVVIQEVKVPVPVKCKVKKPIPPESKVEAADLEKTNTYVKVKLLAEDADAYRFYSKEVGAALAQCAEFIE